ncbi:optineurin isoform X2 [Cylas formicarius]|uniref:optineurin isoform X2 n=1 Tax=Cylas formicarius TaxID=197179 RepID=UPI002958B63B|nr:optineurin isoform X2 [Cylas formicarius]
MATSGTHPFSSESLQMPAEPPPVPSISRSIIGSDDESFVVLGHSLVPDSDDATSIDLGIDLLGDGIIPGAQQLINQELARMEEASLSKNDPILSESQCSQLDQSTILPLMPQVANTIPKDVNGTISIVSFAPSELVSEELQVKVSTLIDENIRLKETIMQNNMSMKAQYERIVAWQDEVQKVHETHKAKFLQAKQCIEGLKTENNLLKEELMVLKETVNRQTKEMDQKLVEVTEKNMKEFELDMANKKLKELELEPQNVIPISEAGKGKEDSLTAKFEQKLLNYEKLLEESYKKIRDLETELKNAKISDENVELTEKVELDKKCLEEANEKIRTMQLAHDKIVSNLTQDLYILNGKTIELEKMVKFKTAELENVKKDGVGKLSQVEEAKHQLDILVKDLQRQLEEAKIEVWRVKSRETEKVQAQTHVYNQPAVVAASYEELAHLRHQLQQSQMVLTHYEHGRVAANQQIETLTNQVEELRCELENKGSYNPDDLYAFKTQAELYKSDFESERESKNAINREKMKLTEDLQALHRRNQQLQEEVELLREQALANAPSTTLRSQQSHWGNNSPTASRYYCPICNMKFRSVRLVQDHLETSVCHL